MLVPFIGVSFKRNIILGQAVLDYLAVLFFFLVCLIKRFRMATPRRKVHASTVTIAEYTVQITGVPQVGMFKSAAAPWPTFTANHQCMAFRSAHLKHWLLLGPVWALTPSNSSTIPRVQSGLDAKARHRLLMSRPSPYHMVNSILHAIFQVLQPDWHQGCAAQTWLVMLQDAKAAELSAYCSQWGTVHRVELARSDSSLIRQALLRSHLDDRLKATVASGHKAASNGRAIRPYIAKVL